MNKTSSNLIAFGVGVATGTALGMLFAPEEGKSTRNKLTYTLSKYSSELRDIVTKLYEQEVANVNDAKTEGSRVIKDTKEQAEKLLGDVESLIGQIKKGSH